MQEEETGGKEVTLDEKKIGWYGLAMLLPILLVFGLPYLLIWGYRLFKTGYSSFVHYLLPVILVGALLHELLHAATWAVFCKHGIRSVKLGFNLRLLSPYAHCKEPLRRDVYLAGAVMPCFLLGIVPAVFGLIGGNGLWLLTGMLFIWAASGDILSCFKLLKISKRALIADHPEKIGFYVYEK